MKNKIEIFTLPLYYIFITLLLYGIFTKLYIKTRIAILHPLVMTAIILILYIYFVSYINNNDKIDTLQNYNSSLNIINLMLGPLTVVLAVPIYKNWLILKKYWFPILVSTFVGTVISVTSVYLLGISFNLDHSFILSLIPKSVTSAIAKEISTNAGGIPEITIAAVIFTGILGAILGPILAKLFKFNDPLSSGLSFGITSHAVGTSKAMETSLEAGAISSIAIATTGILTMIVTLFL